VICSTADLFTCVDVGEKAALLLALVLVKILEHAVYGAADGDRSLFTEFIRGG
jgi:hypothetical protein